MIMVVSLTLITFTGMLYFYAGLSPILGEIEVQRVQIQELMATVSRLSEATTCSEGIGSAPTQVGYFDNPDERL